MNGFRRQIIIEALQVHDAECCSADRPCRTRANLDTQLRRPDEPVQISSDLPTRLDRSGQGTGRIGRTSGTNPSISITPKQRAYIESLLKRKEVPPHLIKWWKAADEADQGNFALLTELIRNEKAMVNMNRWASTFIDTLRDLPDRTAATEGGAAQRPVTGRQDEPAQPGYYQDETFRFVKVQKAVHGSGRPYAKVWDADSRTWTYEKGLVYRELRPLGPQEAKQFGDLYGCCIRCGTVLTDEDSIERGIGPVCAAKMGW